MPILISKKRIIFVFSGIIFSFLLLALRLGYIQIVQHQFFLKISQSQKHSLPPGLPRLTRGTIYDRQGKELAVSVIVDSCYAIPYKIKNPKLYARKLCPILNLNYKKTLQKLDSHSSFVWLKRKLNPKTVEKIKREDLSGIAFIKEEKRFYPLNNLACHVIGLAGLDNQGLAGIEYYFDNYLRGRSIKRLEEEGIDSKDTLNSAGCSIALTIDEVIQYIAEKELKKAFVKFHAKAATIIIQNPRNGEILAIANFPNFNPNKINSFDVKYLRNPAVSDIFEPGSTFKVVTAAASLEEKLVRRREKIFCENGVYQAEGFYVRDHEKKKWLTFDEVIEKSSNIGITKIAFRLQNINLYKYARDFGFGNFTCIDLPNEVKGILHPPEKWTKRSLSAVSFGHEVGVTAVQLTAAFSCIANSGVLMQPQIVKCLINEKGGVVKKFKPVKVRQVISPSTARMMTEILEGVVKQGTGIEASIKGYKVAGKTGTAQKLNPKTNTYSESKYIASFIGFLPLDNPQITILVVLDEPQQNYWGGCVAAPVFRQVGLQVMNYLNISPSIEEDSDFIFRAEKERLIKNGKFKQST